MLFSYIVAALSAILTIFTAFPGPVLRFGVHTATLGAHVFGLLPSPENSTIAPPPTFMTHALSGASTYAVKATVLASYTSNILNVAEMLNAR
ncbi:hypothetical protein LTR66_013751 [Elasticomyces elasticus]|nr:hypothetical protein LTR66_013751 [Elasticomyces elasticus]KAK4960858.1 hypothetical protein LTR28_004847 [Elasticomyces elasticus]